MLFKITHDRVIGVDKGEYSDYKVHIVRNLGRIIEMVVVLVFHTADEV